MTFSNYKRHCSHGAYISLNSASSINAYKHTRHVAVETAVVVSIIYCWIKYNKYIMFIIMSLFVPVPKGKCAYHWKGSNQCLDAAKTVKEFSPLSAESRNISLIGKETTVSGCSHNR